MSSLTNFSRQVSFTNEQMQDIRLWTKCSDLGEDELLNKIKSKGIGEPIGIYYHNQYRNSLRYLSAENKEFRISFFYNATIYMGSNAVFMIVEGNESTTYRLDTGIQVGRQIQMNGNDFSYMCGNGHLYGVSLTLSNNTYLSISIAASNFNMHDNITKKQQEDFEKYLLGLNTTVNVKDVYENIVRIFKLPLETTIIIKYYESPKQLALLGNYFIENGKLLYYAILENNEVFYVSYDGDWHYRCGGIKILYSKDSKNTELTFKIQNESDISKLYRSEDFFNRIKRKISELQAELAK